MTSLVATAPALKRLSRFLRTVGLLLAVTSWPAAGTVVSAQESGSGQAGAATADEEAAAAERAYLKASASVLADLDTALEELATVRARIGEEKPPLARETSRIEAEWREKQRLAELAKQERDALVHDLQSLSERVRLWRDESTYIEGLLLEYRKEFEARATLAAAEAWREDLLAADAPGQAGLDAKLKILESSLGLLGERLGPVPFAGQALDGEGVAREGTFIEAGPVSWFVAEDGETAGLVSERTGLRPELVPGSVGAGPLRQVIAGESASLPFDPTLGKALALEQQNRSFFEHVREGGIWIYPILLLALIAALAALVKWIQLARFKPLRPTTVRNLLQALEQGEEGQARELAAGLRHPARSLLERGIDLRERGRDEVEEALYERYLEVQPALQRGLPLIAIAAATAPLLGLLGTVTGMIHTFKLINIFGTGDAKSLASGISEALVTTEFGLAVAIPALIVHALLSRKVQGLRATLEMTSLAFVNGLEGGGAKTEEGGVASKVAG